MLVSLGLHGAAVGALLAAAIFRPDAVPQSAAPMVMEVSLVTASPSDPQKLIASGQERVEAKASDPARHPAQKTPPLDIAEADTGDIPPPERPQPEQDRPKMVTAEQTSAPLSIAARPAPMSSAPTIGAAASVSATAEQSWEGLVLAAFERKKRYPSLAQRLRQQDVVLVRIIIDRRGNVTDAAIRRSQGFAALDGEVLSLVRRVSPLPQPPADVSGERISLTVPVQFFVRQGRP
ncbi:energy transducer TonB [Novosphingobium sp. CF614]|uniref:energy transducer TonB family protein n=1 Tax=Novosphingobium sp. CF614 TaxID=1884364 RepID=UPI001160D75C|nr:TonB family protein [Novosphingobium sp. CF614]